MKWLSKNFCNFTRPNSLPPNSSDCNNKDFNLFSTVEEDINLSPFEAEIKWLSKRHCKEGYCGDCRQHLWVNYYHATIIYLEIIIFKLNNFPFGLTIVFLFFFLLLHETNSSPQLKLATGCLERISQCFMAHIGKWVKRWRFPSHNSGHLHTNSNDVIVWKIESLIGLKMARVKIRFLHPRNTNRM